MSILCLSSVYLMKRQSIPFAFLPCMQFWLSSAMLLMPQQHQHGRIAEHGDNPVCMLSVVCLHSAVTRASTAPDDDVCCLQLDAAWMAASAGLSVVIASGKDKDGVLQVTAGVRLYFLLISHLLCPSACVALLLMSLCQGPWVNLHYLPYTSFMYLSGHRLVSFCLF